MKLQNKIIALSMVAALAMLTGCGSDEEESKSATYSDTAVKSIVDYYVDRLGNKVVDINETLSYNDKNQLVKTIEKDYSYDYKDYFQNDGTAQVVPAVLVKNAAVSYAISIVTCNYTPNEDGFALTKVCEDSYLYSVNGGAEMGYGNFSDYDQTNHIDPAIKDKEGKSFKGESQYAYNDNDYVTEVKTVVTHYHDINGTINGDLNTYKVTYNYETYSDDINDPIAQTVVKRYNDTGSIVDGIVDGKLDGIADHWQTRIYDFSYNEDRKLDIVATTIRNVGPVYKTPAVQPAGFADVLYVYDGSQLDFVENTTGLGDSALLSNGKLVYKDGRLNGFTGHVADYNNDDLNQYKWNDSFLEYFYEGNEVVRVKDAGRNMFTEITYENFSNVLTSYKPLSDFLDDDLNVEGQLVYTGFKTN